MARIGESRPWDAKAKAVEVTPPLSQEEFFQLHVIIWGSLEFCRLCNEIVYRGECSRCGEEDRGGERYRITRVRSNGTGYELIKAHVHKLALLGGSVDSTPIFDTSTFGTWTKSAAVQLVENPLIVHYDVAGIARPQPEPEVVLMIDEEVNEIYGGEVEEAAHDALNI